MPFVIKVSVILSQVDDENKYRCDHPWDPKFELPIGNPITGRWVASFCEGLKTTSYRALI